MADPVASVEKIVKLGLQIKEAVDTVRHNEEECREIRKRVLRFSAILSQLQQTGLMNDSPAMSGALEDLEGTLQHALELVRHACQERSTIRRLITAGDLSKQLRRVKDDILNNVMLASFAVNTQNTIELLNIKAAGGHPPPRQPQDAGVVGSTDDARTELNDVENSVIAGSEVPLDPLLVAMREFRWSELEVATNSFSDGNIIARGGSFTVYKGVLKGGNIVAIKRRNSTEYTQWVYEVYDLFRAVSKLQHENIVQFVGYCNQVSSTSEVQLWKCKTGQPREREILWVEEYVANGSLQDIIHDSRTHWSSLFQIIYGIAKGLHYLHEQNVVHMDVKPLNILLDSDMNPKITDFELSVVLPEKIINHEYYLKGTVAYAVPEYILDGTVSTKNDVYAFGITLLETISSMCKSKPPPAPQGLYDQDWMAWKAVLKLKNGILDPALFEASDLRQIRRCIQTGLLCAQHYRGHRPSMHRVLEMLNGNEKLPDTKRTVRSKRHPRRDRRA